MYLYTVSLDRTCYVLHVFIIDSLFLFTGIITCKMCAARHNIQSKYLEQVRLYNLSCTCMQAFYNPREESKTLRYMCR